jgi:hypothetical protein
MRTGELIAAVVVGALLFAVGYELGRAGRPEQAPEANAVDVKALEREIQARLEDKIMEREHELVESVITRVEQLLSDESKFQDAGRPVSENIKPEPGDTRVEQLEKTFDELLVRTEAELERKHREQEAKARAEELSRRKREPFDVATLREFEEARKRMLEERRKLKEEEEKRGNKRR